MLSDYLTSVIRTVVPAAVGAVLAWLAARYGLGMDEQSSAGLTAGVTALTISVYYALARALESRWPKLGRLLGAAKAPVYRG